MIMTNYHVRIPLWARFITSVRMYTPGTHTWNNTVLMIVRYRQLLCNVQIVGQTQLFIYSVLLFMVNATITGFTIFGLLFFHILLRIHRVIGRHTFDGVYAGLRDPPVDFHSDDVSIPCPFRFVNLLYDNPGPSLPFPQDSCSCWHFHFEYICCYDCQYWIH